MHIRLTAAAAAFLTLTPWVICLAADLDAASADAGSLMDSATRCGLPTAPIQSRLEAMISANSLSASERARLMVRMETMRQIAPLSNKPAYDCDYVRRILAKINGL